MALKFWLGGMTAMTLLGLSPLLAQDVPGIEICTVEKTMERRTSCLQSNVNFLQATLTKQQSAAQQKLDAANRQIEELKTAIAGLRKDLDALKTAKPASEQKSDKDKDKVEPAKK